MKVKITAEEFDIAHELNRVADTQDDEFGTKVLDVYVADIVDIVINNLVVEVDRDVDFTVDATILPFPRGVVG